MKRLNIPSATVLIPREKRIRAIQELYEHINKVIDNFRDYAEKEKTADIDASTFPTLDVLEDNTSYTITVESSMLEQGALVLPEIPSDTSNGIVIYLIAQTSFSLAFPTGYTPQWYGEIPDLQIEQGSKYCLSILDGVCALAEIVSQ